MLLSFEFVLFHWITCQIHFNRVASVKDIHISKNTKVDAFVHYHQGIQLHKCVYSTDKSTTTSARGPSDSVNLPRSCLTHNRCMFSIPQNDLVRITKKDPDFNPCCKKISLTDFASIIEELRETNGLEFVTYGRVRCV